MRLALLLCSLLSLPTMAVAQSSDTLRVGALRSDARTPLALRSEELELECQEPPAPEAGMPCTIRIRYTLENLGEEAAAVALRMSLENGEGFVVGDVGSSGTAEAPVLTPRRFPFGAGAQRTLELSGNVLIEAIHDVTPQGNDAISARHPLLATSSHGEDRGFLFSRAVSRHFVDAPDEFTVRVHLPEGFALADASSLTFLPAESTEGWSVYRIHRPIDDSAPDFRVVVRRGEVPVVRNGGPFIALGGVVLGPTGVAPANVFWARLGYEIGFVDWALVSVAAETDFSSRFAVSAMLEAASPSFGIPPSFSVGIGTAVRLLSESPNVEAGVRLAVGAVLFSVGFEALFDYFPIDNGFTITLLGRAGL